MLQSLRDPRLLFLIGLIALAVLSRWLPHPPNFTPIAAIALFAGARISDPRLALLVPLVALAISDLVLGLHGLLWLVYGSMLLTVWMGTRLRGALKMGPLIGWGLASSVLFFVLTNLAVWMLGGTDMSTGLPYTRDLPGLLSCYTMALPFFHNTWISTLVYSVLLFGLEAWAARRWLSIRAVAQT